MELIHGCGWHRYNPSNTSAEEAKKIKLAEKQSIEELELAWTRDAKRFVDDTTVLRELEPPDMIKILTLTGYNSISFPSWLMSIATYLPYVWKVVMEDLPCCNVLPPLGQLPNLKSLHIGGMGSIRKIDGGFYGGQKSISSTSGVCPVPYGLPGRVERDILQ